MGPALDLEDYRPSVLLHCWLGYLTCKIVSEMWDVKPYNTIPSSINTNGHYKSLLLTLFFCFRTVNLELFTSTYSLYRQTLNIQASTKVTLLLVCFHCLVTLRQRL